MIEKSPDVKLYEQADLFLDEFRASVHAAQKRAHDSGRTLESKFECSVSID